MKRFFSLLPMLVLAFSVCMVLINCDQNDGTTTYTVTFNSKGGSTVSAISGISSGSTITLPDTPIKGTDDFLGWFTDEGTFQNEFTASTPVIGDITVYAKWSLSSGVTYDGQIYYIIHEVGDDGFTPFYSQGAPLAGLSNSSISGSNNFNGSLDLLTLGSISNNKVILSLPETVSDNSLTSRSGILAGDFRTLYIDEHKVLDLECLDGSIPKLAYFLYANTACATFDYYGQILDIKQGWNYIWHDQWGENNDYVITDNLQALFDTGYKWYYGEVHGGGGGEG
jgi:uncharacterized repeat protein (TIGR02543 family)